MFATWKKQANPVNGHWLPKYYFQRDDYLDTANRMRPECYNILYELDLTIVRVWVLEGDPRGALDSCG